MAVSGGAFIPPVMGAVSTAFGVVSSFFVLVICMVYLVSVGIYSLKK
jgi:fucose permease